MLRSTRVRPTTSTRWAWVETDGWWGHNGEGLGYTAANFHNTETGATIAVFFNLSDYKPKAHPADQLFRRLAAVIESAQ